MIRSSIQVDLEAILNLAVSAGLFSSEETEPLAEVLKEYFALKSEEGHKWVSDELDGDLVGVAYYCPAPFADRTWYVKMIAVQPELQRKGRGAALMSYIEDLLRAEGQRVLLVETSGLPKYERTREFYSKCGYDQEARIRDYYTDGDDMVVFRKKL